MEETVEVVVRIAAMTTFVLPAVTEASVIAHEVPAEFTAVFAELTFATAAEPIGLKLSGHGNDTTAPVPVVGAYVVTPAVLSLIAFSFPALVPT